MGTKICRTCKTEKPLGEFYPNPKNVRSGFRADCKTCTGQRRRTRYRETGGTESHRQLLRSRHSMTPAEYAAKFTAQDGRCALCGEPERSLVAGRPRRLAVDHNRATGAVRDLLCQVCNTLIGALEARVHLIGDAREYLLRHQAGSS